MKDIWRLLKYLRFYRGKAVLAVVLAVLAALLAVVQLPAFLPLFEMLFGDQNPQEMLDWFMRKFPGLLSWARQPLEAFLTNTLANDPIKVLVWAVGLIVFLSLIKGLTIYSQAYTVGKIQTGTSRRIAAELYRHVLGMSMSFYNRKGTPSVMARFTNDVEAVGRGLTTLFGKGLIDPLRLVGFLILAGVVNWQLLLLNVALFPAVGSVMYIFGRKSKRAMKRGLHSRDRLVNILQETFEGVAIVKAFNMQRREEQRFREENERVRHQDFKLAKAAAATNPLVEFLGFLGVGISFIAAGYWVSKGRMESADIVLFYGALLSTSDPIRKLSRFNNNIQMLVAASRRVFDYLDEATDIVEKHNAGKLTPFSKEIAFERVYFTYDNVETVLRGVDLVARKGETIALVGPSGAGKSTIARLIPRFYDTTSGRVTIDGTDLREVTLSSLRDQIGLVTQEVILFNDTIAGNISYGRPDASDEEVIAAAQAANADSFIRDIPGGYQAVVGEKGLTLSGGQRQRIALARAILKDAPILILDEATSSLDSESEFLIQQALDEFMQYRTSIVIAHRLSTVERASRIYVLDEGEIVASGTNEELLESSPLYRKLYQMQFHTAGFEPGRKEQTGEGQSLEVHG